MSRSQITSLTSPTPYERNNIFVQHGDHVNEFHLTYRKIGGTLARCRGCGKQVSAKDKYLRRHVAQCESYLTEES